MTADVALFMSLGTGVGTGVVNSIFFGPKFGIPTGFLAAMLNMTLLFLIFS